MEVAILDLKPFLYSGLKKPEVLLGSVKLSEETFEREIFPCGAVLYLIEFIRKNLRGYNVLGCMDSSKSFRRDIYPLYKANRKNRLSKAEYNALNINIKLMEIVLEYVGIPMCIKQGIEADDLIASAVKNYSKADHIYIYTPDSDLRCWVSPTVSIRAINSRTRDVDYAEGTPYSVISIYKCINGDESDNIPPVNEPNIGKLFSVLPYEEILLDRDKLLSLSKILFPKNEDLQRNIKLVLQETHHETPLTLPLVDNDVLSRLNKAISVLSGNEQDSLLERTWINKLKSY